MREFRSFCNDFEKKAAKAEMEKESALRDFIFPKKPDLLTKVKRGVSDFIEDKVKPQPKTPFGKAKKFVSHFGRGMGREVKDNWRHRLLEAVQSLSIL